MAGGVAPGAGSENATHDGKNYTGPLIIVTLLFFMWGFITCLNDILIPKFREFFGLEGWEAMLVQSAFFAAFFVVALTYYLISVSGKDPIQKMGYKKAIIIGLLVAATGCAMFYPAAIAESFSFFLVALFVLASGITILQMGANPYVSLLGSSEGASSRLNLTQAFNSLGTTIAPIAGGILIFAMCHEETGLEVVEAPYIALTIALVVLAIFIGVSKLPKVTTDSAVLGKGKGAIKYNHLVLGVICIFTYVGGEVSIGSEIITFLGLPDVAGLEHAAADKYLAVYWGGAMIGRFFGAIFLNEGVKIKEKIVPLVGILLLSVVLVLFLTNKDVFLAYIQGTCPGAAFPVWNFTASYIFGGIVVGNLIAFYIGKSKPGFTLGLFASIVVGLLLMVMIGSGQTAMWSILCIGLFNSIMFPTIFTLAIKGLGVDTAQGASLLVMAIVGGAIIPPLQGVFEKINMHFSFIIPMFCYLYIAYYGFIGSKPKEGQLQATS